MTRCTRGSPRQAPGWPRFCWPFYGRVERFRLALARGARTDNGCVEWTFIGEVIEWRGPAPYLFVPMTPEDSEDLKEEARGLVYWGQVPVEATIGNTDFTTALFPRDGRYLLPVKVAVQRAEGIAEGSVVEVGVRINTARRR